MSEVYREGVGAELLINGTTRPFKQFYDRIPQVYGWPAERDSLHATLLYPQESAVDIFSERDLISLRHTTGRMNKLLSRLPLQETVIHPESESLEIFGRHLAIVIHETPFLRELRGGIEEIVEEELGVRVSSRDYRMHVSTTRLHPNRRNFVPKDFRPKIPSDIHVDGFRLLRRTIDFRPQKKRQKFTNKPAALRAV